MRDQYRYQKYYDRFLNKVLSINDNVKQCNLLNKIIDLYNQHINDEKNTDAEENTFESGIHIGFHIAKMADTGMIFDLKSMNLQNKMFLEDYFYIQKNKAQYCEMKYINQQLGFMQSDGKYIDKYGNEIKIIKNEPQVSCKNDYKHYDPPYDTNNIVFENENWQARYKGSDSPKKDPDSYYDKNNNKIGKIPALDLQNLPQKNYIWIGNQQKKIINGQIFDLTIEDMV